MKKGKKVLLLALAFGIIAPGVSASADSIKSYNFKGMDAPKSIQEMAVPYSKASVEITYQSGAKKTFPLEWKELFNTAKWMSTVNGQKIPASTPLDVNGNPIKADADYNGISDYYVSQAPDGNTILEPINGKLYMVSHYESTAHASGNVPDTMTVSELKQNADGSLEAISVQPINFSNVNGLWIPCNGSKTPWNTHLGSEEYEPNARDFADDKGSRAYGDVTAFAKLYFGDETKANPYYYGWAPEVTVNADGSTKVVKHYAMGRYSKELGQVLSDNKTVLFGDDGSNVVIFMFVADQEGDLSSGTLYAADFTQTSDKDGGAGSLKWISLGHGTNIEIEDIINSGVAFHDIFEVSNEPQEGFTPVRTNSQGNKVTEYLKLKPGMEKAAAFLESRRYAAMKGATAEFRKMEGVALNNNDNKAYLAMSEINNGMLAQPDVTEIPDKIKLPREDAGAVYELPLAAGQKDSEGNQIKSTAVPTSMKAIVVGKTLEKPDAYGNAHDVNKVSNPDNLNFSNTMNTLFIGEDSGSDEGHVNNFLWAYEPTTGELERIMSAPAGAEVASLSVADNRNGHTYITAGFQHASDNVADAPITAVNKEELVKTQHAGPYGNQDSAAIGYLQVGKKGNEVKPNATNKNNSAIKITPSVESTKEVYTVKSGDTLSAIGLKYGVKWEDLATYNNLKNPHLILVGQKINIPNQ